MPVEVNVREIRRRLLAEGVELAGGDGQSAAAAGLCSVFQDVVAGFFSPGSPLYVTAVLEDVPVGAATWRTALVDAVYRGVVGPMLERQRATLTQLPEQVAAFWEATIRLCDWLAGLLLAVHRKQRLAERCPGSCRLRAAVARGTPRAFLGRQRGPRGPGRRGAEGQ